MNLSISNIAWSADMDEKVYNMMEDIGFTGLEIAPTRIFADCPYESEEKTSDWQFNSLLITDYMFHRFSQFGMEEQKTYSHLKMNV